MSIVLENLVKRFAGHPVVNNISLEVANGEFFVLLGPSGSGKSTVLRMIAGLVDIEQGRVLLHDRDVTELPPQQRGAGLVFQHYALFRHMSVAQNIEFPLRIRRVPAKIRRARRDQLLEIVGLAGLGGRMPSQLSGGQQQRVALARALAHEPGVLLLDEPFGALDAKIRSELRQSIRTVQRELKITTIFVTHDQEEAFELADRLGIMNFGRLLEVGPPLDLYLRPQTEFVASFLGTANLMVGESVPDGIRLGPIHISSSAATTRSGESARVQVLFRPEDVAVKDSSEALSWPVLGKAIVEESSFAGSFERLRLRLPPIPGVRAIAPPAPFGSDSIVLEASRSQHHALRYPLRRGDAAWVGVRRVHALTHPGLRFLLVTDGTPESDAAIALGSQIARMAHARVTLLASGLGDGAAQALLKETREQMGSGLATLESRTSRGPVEEGVGSETAREHYDLVVQGSPPKGRLEQVERVLRAVDSHLLLVPGPGTVPSRVLICVAVGEPGKEDVLFSGRLVRHLGAQATILTVLRDGHSDLERQQANRFLAAGVRTLSLLGVSAETAVRAGDVVDEVRLEAARVSHELLVMGAPLVGRKGEINLDGLGAGLLTGPLATPVLLVRSHHSAPRWAMP